MSEQTQIIVKNLSKDQKIIGGVGFRVLGSALSGATGGTLIGSYFGLVGGILGGIIGAAVTGYSDYKEINRVKGGK